MASAGVSIKLHYCGERISGISLYSDMESNCCCKAANKKAKCCSDKEVKVSIKEVQKPAPSFSFSPLHLSDVAIENFHVNSMVALSAPSHLLPQATGPPPEKGVSVFLTNCCFRI